MQPPETTLADIRARMADACAGAGRDAESVHLLAVSKTRTADEIRAMAALGQRDFGENYLQEALDKMDRLADLDLVWHFIGPVQSNKTRVIAARFHWLHSLDRLKIARRLSEQRPPELEPLNVCIQVNMDREDTKSGVLPEDVGELAEQVAALPGLRLRGLMCIPRADAPDRNRVVFHEMAMTLSQLRNRIGSLDTLSMGMSGDYDVAIEEGATWVRLGTALFGPRP